MPLHDWTHVETSTFHDFHTRWIAHLTEWLNRGLLPNRYYAQAEQHLGRKVGDILTLHESDPTFLRTAPVPPLDSGGVALLETAPRVMRTGRFNLEPRGQRTLTIRHTSGHRIIALLEIVSPGNLGSTDNLGEFTRKVVEALKLGIHVVVLDVFPPGDHDTAGLHVAITHRANTDLEEEEPLPEDRPLSFLSYAADPPSTTAYQEYRAVGEELPELPLFLSPTRYIPLPLKPTYDTAVAGMASYWRAILEGRTPE